MGSNQLRSLVNVVFRNVNGTHNRTLVWNNFFCELSSPVGPFCYECAHNSLFKRQKSILFSYIFFYN